MKHTVEVNNQSVNSDLAVLPFGSVYRYSGGSCFYMKLKMPYTQKYTETNTYAVNLRTGDVYDVNPATPVVPCRIVNIVNITIGGLEK